MEAIIEAYNNLEYTTLYDDMKGAVFLGTPHRGADLASILHSILKVSFSSSSFVKQLKPRSDAIKSINNGFIHRAGSLTLVSYFETQNTRVIQVIKVYCCSDSIVAPGGQNDCAGILCYSRIPARAQSWTKRKSSHDRQVQFNPGSEFRQDCKRPAENSRKHSSWQRLARPPD